MTTAAAPSLHRNGRDPSDLAAAPGDLPPDAHRVRDRGRPRRGIYALAGEVAGKVGGAIWTSFLLAGILAAFTATAYAELVTKYPQAAGAALYAHKAYRRPFLTFLIAFAVMCSGVASAATLATAFGGDYLSEFVTLPKMLVAAAFIGFLALVNFRGIKESVHLNLGLTASSSPACCSSS